MCQKGQEIFSNTRYFLNLEKTLPLRMLVKVCVIYDIHGIHVFNPNVSVVGLPNSFTPKASSEKNTKELLSPMDFVPLPKPFQQCPKK